MRQEIIVFGVILVSFSLGLSASYIVNSQPDECKKIEQQIKQKQKFNGSLSCYPPGVLDVNVSERLEQKAELNCVCRKIYDGNVQVFPILKTG